MCWFGVLKVSITYNPTLFYNYSHVIIELKINTSCITVQPWYYVIWGESVWRFTWIIHLLSTSLQQMKYYVNILFDYWLIYHYDQSSTTGWICSSPSVQYQYRYRTYIHSVYRKTCPYTSSDFFNQNCFQIFHLNALHYPLPYRVGFQFLKLKTKYEIKFSGNLVSIFIIFITFQQVGETNSSIELF